MTFVFLVAGMVLLVGGAEVMVRGASRLAIGLGISPLIVGLTVVAFGTSSPEMAVSVQASLSGESDIAMGNVVGSNIFNILVILGISAVIVPLAVAQRLIRLDVPLMVGVSILVLVLGQNGALGRLEGLLLFSSLLAYLGFAVYESRRDGKPVEEEYEAEFGDGKGARTVVKDLLMVAGGLALLVLGSEWLVDGATEIALDLGVSDLIVGLTIVAAGTSMPEVATSVIAAVKGERDIAVGNAVGSNMFNLLGVLGLGAIVSGEGLLVSGAVAHFDAVVMTAVAVACLPVFFGGIITRWEGLLFLGYYFAYLGYVVLDASGHDALDAYSLVMLVVVVPLTVLALIASVTWKVHKSNGGASESERLEASG